MSAETSRIDRREAIKWMLTATASLAVWDGGASGAPAPLGAKGYGMDPDLLKGYSPGDVWPLTLNAQQRRTTKALCDVIIPSDDRSPKASDVGVAEFIDEWISSPYPAQVPDRKIILDGLAWIDEEAQRRFGRDFASLDLEQQTLICDDICNPAAAKPGLKPVVAFFKRFRDLTAGGYYSTPVGMRDLGYVGNVAQNSFAGPTPEVLRHIGLA